MKLRSYIRLLAEKAISGSVAIDNGLALVRSKQGNTIFYVLYDPKILAKVVQEPGFWSSRFSVPLDQIIHGFMQVLPHSGDCHNATEIKCSAAVKGYGPLLYDMVMSDSDGGLIPDRVSTSTAANKIWQFYSNNRNDVEKKPLDDKDNPKTPEIDDDCDLVKDLDKILNFAYDGPGQSGSKSQLLQRHEDVSQQFSQHGIKNTVLNKILVQMGQTLFDQKYGRE